MFEKLRERIATHPRPRFWVVGDVMLDRYLQGEVDRVSPEAPVPVLRLTSTLDRAGGAANVAQNLSSLGGDVALAGLVGADEAGETLLGVIGAAGLTTAALRRGGGPTTVKTRALAGAQQLLRVDHEQRVKLDPTEQAELIAGLVAVMPLPDVILVSDYDKGVISAALVQALRARMPHTPLFVDPKGRDYTRYRGASLITPNEREAALAAGVEIVDETSMIRAVHQLHQVLPGVDVVVTRGANGMTLVGRDENLLHSPAQARRTFDVTGAGDTAIAALAVARTYQLDWPDALHLANVAAGIAVGKIGAVPVLQTELLAALGHDDFSVKLLGDGSLGELRRTASLLGKKIVFTNGCFDILHLGHLRLLQGARALGDLLVVAVNSDASVKRLKGDSRPIVGEGDRSALLCGLEAVDYVTIFTQDTPLETIRALKPDVLVKGGDYTHATIVGAELVDGWGGKVITIPLVEGRSTTGIVQRMNQ